MKTLTKLTLAIKKVRHIKKAILALVLLASVITANAQGYHYVRPYYRHDGTPVRGHYRSNPDGNPYNNLNYPGNENPFHPEPSIHTMPRGYSGGLDPDSGLNLDLD
jgi:hypothetical protein